VVVAQTGRFVPAVAANVGVVVAALFLLVPAQLSWREGRDLHDYGFRADPLGKSLALGCGVPLVVFPLFVFGFIAFFEIVCGNALSTLALPGQCARYQGWESFDLRVWANPAKAVAIQLLVVALPEELFFRGFLHELIEKALPAKRRFLGGGMGRALILSSALFAVGHLAVDFDLRRLAVFFPGLLFGWMRSATGSILAGTITHASSNLFIRILEKSFL